MFYSQLLQFKSAYEIMLIFLGILSLLLSLTVFGVCSYLGLYMNWGFDKSKTIALGSAIYCVFCALVMHVVALVKGELEKESKGINFIYLFF